MEGQLPPTNSVFTALHVLHLPEGKYGHVCPLGSGTIQPTFLGFQHDQIPKATKNALSFLLYYVHMQCIIFCPFLARCWKARRTPIIHYSSYLIRYFSIKYICTYVLKVSKFHMTRPTNFFQWDHIAHCSKAKSYLQ